MAAVNLEVYFLSFVALISSSTLTPLDLGCGGSATSFL
jgi:hypothetical protein